MTGLGQEALEAMGIAAVTAAALATGRRDGPQEERPGLVRRRRRRLPAGIGLVSALAALALGAAALVVALFGPHPL